MALVKLFGNLREMAGSRESDIAGETVREVLDALCRDNEALRAAILDGDGLQPHVRVMSNGRDVELHRGLDTPIGEHDQLAIFPPIAGGGTTGSI